MGSTALARRGGIALDFLERFQTFTTGIGSTISVGSTPYERTARSVRAILGLEMISVIVVGVYAYLTFPAQVPLPFEFNGHAYALAPKWVFLLLAALLNILQLVFLLVSGARYALINRYPFAINIPGFRSNLSQLDYERRGYWMNRLSRRVDGCDHRRVSDDLALRGPVPDSSFGDRPRRFLRRVYPPHLICGRGRSVILSSRVLEGYGDRNQKMI
jgi:hypothetical protein